jgi:hypothetical protein
MIPQEKILVISNGNDGQIPFLIPLYRSLYHPGKGAFTGDFMFFSDRLSEESQSRLDKTGVPYTLLDEETVNEWENLLPSQKHALGKVAKPLFIKNAIESLGENYRILIYIDPDILVQKPIMEVLKPLEEAGKGIFYSAQSNPTLSIRWPKMQLERTFNSGHLTPENLNNFQAEINTGFMFGDIPSIEEFMEDLLFFMTSEPFNLYANADEGSDVQNDWHDQDFYRVFARLDENDKKFSILPEGYIYHLCNDVYQEFQLKPFSTRLKHKSTGEIPHLVHFAGGVWVHYFRLSFFFLGFAGLRQWLESKTRRPLRMARNTMKRIYHAFRRWWIPKYRFVKQKVKKLFLA